MIELLPVTTVIDVDDVGRWPHHKRWADDDDLGLSSPSITHVTDIQVSVD